MEYHFKCCVSSEHDAEQERRIRKFARRVRDFSGAVTASSSAGSLAHVRWSIVVKFEQDPGSALTQLMLEYSEFEVRKIS